MAAIKPLETVVQHWVQVAQQRTPEYQAGIESPARDWQQATLAAGEDWKNAVVEAARRSLFTKGVQRTSTAEWQQMALNKGVPNYANGVRLSTEKYRKAWEPYHAAIARLRLPRRYPRRDPRNRERINAVIDALIATKLGGPAGGTSAS